MDGCFPPFRILVASLLAALALICLSIASDAAESVGTIRQATNKVYGATLDRALRSGEAIVPHQTLSSATESGASVHLADDTMLFIGEQTALKLDHFTYDSRAKRASGALDLARGLIRVLPEGAKTSLVIRTDHASLAAEGAAFDVLALPGATELAVHRGSVAVSGRYGGTTVNRGEIFRIVMGAPPTGLAALSLEMMVAQKQLMGALDGSEVSPQAAQAKQELTKALDAIEGTPAFKDAIKGKKMENVVYLDTTAGRIAIEMLPDQAPRHVADIKDLLRAKFYDGQSFTNVVPGFVAEAGDASAKADTIKTEPAKIGFARGVVGMKHARAKSEDSPAQFFILTGPARQFDGQYTAWGRVIFGLDVVDQLHAGTPPDKPDRIVAMKLASDPPGLRPIVIPCRESDRRLGSCS